jgi:hypothetical protein
MLGYGMKILVICLSFLLGLSYATSSASQTSDSGQLFVDVVEFKFANNYYDLISADENTFVVIERIDVIQDRSSHAATGEYYANNKGGLLNLFMKANDRRRYETILTPADIVANGSQGLAIPAGYTLEAQSTEGVNKAIVSYRVYSQ